MAALFNPRFFSQPEPSFRGLFRLLDDFDQHNAQGEGWGAGLGAVQFFTPKFDIKETETAYELHGELPGIDKKDVSIEFTDPQTVVIRGKVERSSTRGTPPSARAGAIEAAEASGEHKGSITESGEAAATPAMPHKVTVEDEKEAGTAAATDAAAQEGQQQPSEDAPAATSTEVAKTSAAGSEVQKPSAPASKYWVSERSVGQFSRTFHFPSRVDNDATSADLANGILTVIVPKAKKLDGSRRIAIN